MPKGTAEQMQRRKTLATGADENNWAKFKTLEDSVQDYVNWFGYHNTDVKTLLTSAEILVSFMKDKGYFTDTYNNYIGGVKQWL
jgi:DNA-directed RNA polymerase specialized sigma54-like protein